MSDSSSRWNGSEESAPWTERSVALAVSIFFILSVVSLSFVPTASAAPPGLSIDRGREKLTGEALNGSTVKVKNSGSVTAIVTAYVKRAGGEMNYHNIDDVTLIPGETTEIAVNGLADGVGVVSKRGFIYPINTTTVITGQTVPGAPVTVSGSPVIDKTHADEKGHFKLVVPASAVEGNEHEFHIIAGDAVKPGQFGPDDRSQGWMGFKENRVIETVEIGTAEDVGKIDLEFDPLDVSYGLSSAVADFSEEVSAPKQKVVKKSGKKIHRTSRERNVEFRGWKSRGKARISFERIHNFPMDEEVSLSIDDYSGLENVGIADHAGLSAIEKGCEKGSFSISAVPKSPGVAGSLRASVLAGGKKVFDLSKEIEGDGFPEEWKEWLDIGLEKEKARFEAPKVLKKRWSKTNAKNVGGKYKFTKVKFERYGPGNYGSEKIPIEISSGGKNRKFKGKVKLSITSADSSLNAELTDNEVYVGKGEEVNTALRISPDNPKKGGKSKKAVTIMAEEANPKGSEPLSTEIGVVVNLKAASKEVKREVSDSWYEWFDLSAVEGHKFKGNWNKSERLKTEVSSKDGKYTHKKYIIYSYSPEGWKSKSTSVSIRGHNFDGKVKLGVQADPGISARLEDTSLNVGSVATTTLKLKPTVSFDGGKTLMRNVKVYAWDANPPEGAKALRKEKVADVTIVIPSKGPKKKLVDQWKEWFSLETSGHRFKGGWNKEVSGHRVEAKKKDGKYHKKKFEEYTYSLKNWQTASIPVTIKGHNFGGKVNLDIKADPGLKASLRDSSLDVHSEASTVMNVTPSNALLSEDWESGTDGWSNHGGNITGRSHSGSKSLELRGREEISREIDLSGCSGVTISYWEKGWSFDGPANRCEQARLDFYDGNTWHNKLRNEKRNRFGWEKETYDIPDSWLSSNNKIRFKFEDHNCDGCCGGDHWVIDGIKVAGNGSSRANTTSLKHVEVYARDANPPGRTTLFMEGWEDGDANGWKKDFSRKSRGGEDHDSGVSGKAQAHSGSYVMYIHNANRIQRTIDLTEVPASKTVKATWWWKARSCEGCDGVNFLVNGNEVKTEHRRFTGWEKESYDLSPYIGKKVTIGFEGECGPWDYLSVDDLKVTYGVGAVSRKKLADVTIIIPPKGPKEKKVKEWQEWFDLNTSGHKFTGKWDNTIKSYKESTSLTDSGTKYLKKRYAKYSYALQDWKRASLPISIKGHNFDGKVKLGVSADPGIAASLEKSTLDVHSEVSTNLNVKPTIKPSKAGTRMRDVKVYAWDANPPEDTNALRKDVVADITVVVPSHGPKKKLVDQWKEWFELNAPDKIHAWNKWKTSSYSMDWRTVNTEEKTQTKKFLFEDYEGCRNGAPCNKAHEAAEQWATPKDAPSDYKPKVNLVKKQGKVVTWLEKKSKNYETKGAALRKYQSLVGANTHSPTKKYKDLKMENQTDYSEPIEWGAKWWEKKWHFRGYSDKSKAKDKLEAVKNSGSGPYGYGTEYYGEKMYPDKYKAKWYMLNSHSKTYDTKKQAEIAEAYRGRYNGEIEKIVGNRKYKAEWTTWNDHSLRYDDWSDADSKRDSLKEKSDVKDVLIESSWINKDEYVTETKSDWFKSKDAHYGNVTDIDYKIKWWHWKGGYDYKVEWTTTKHHSKTYDERSDAIDKKASTGGSLTAVWDSTDDWHSGHYETVTHKKWFDDKSDHSGNVVGKKCVDHSTYCSDYDYKIKWTTRYWDSTCHWHSGHWKRWTTTEHHKKWISGHWTGCWKKDCHQKCDTYTYKCHCDYCSHYGCYGCDTCAGTYNCHQVCNKYWDSTCHWHSGHWKRWTTTEHHKKWISGHWTGCYKNRTHKKWFDDSSDHSGNVVDTKCVDRNTYCTGYDYKIKWTTKKWHKGHWEGGYDYKVEWTTTKHHSKTYDDWSDADDKRDSTGGSLTAVWDSTDDYVKEVKWFDDRSDHSGTVVDKKFKIEWTEGHWEPGYDYVVQYKKKKHHHRWYDSYSDALAKDESGYGYIESRVSDYDYRLTWDTKSYGSDTFMFKSDAKDAATKGDRHKVFVKPVHWQVEYYEKNWKSKEGFKSESAAENAYQSDITRHGGYTYATDWGVDWTVSWDVPHEKKYTNSDDAWDKYYALDGKDGVKNLEMKDEKVSVGYKAKRHGILKTLKKTTCTYSRRKPWYKRSSPSVRLSVSPRGTGGHKFNGDVKLSVVDASDSRLVAALSDEKVSANGRDESVLSFGGETRYSLGGGYTYEAGPTTGTQWVKVRGKDADGSLTRTKKVKLDIDDLGSRINKCESKTKYDFKPTVPEKGGESAPKADLTVKKEGPGTVSLMRPDGTTVKNAAGSTYTFSEGVKVSLKANADQGAELDEWKDGSGDSLYGGDPPKQITVRMNKDKTRKAVFSSTTDEVKIKMVKVVGEDAGGEDWEDLHASFYIYEDYDYEEGHGKNKVASGISPASVSLSPGSYYIWSDWMTSRNNGISTEYWSFTTGKEGGDVNAGHGDSTLVLKWYPDKEKVLMETF